MGKSKKSQVPVDVEAAKDREAAIAVIRGVLSDAAKEPVVVGQPPMQEGETSTQKRVLTAKEVKDRLRCGLTTVYELFNSGELEGFRLKAGGGGIRIYEASLAKLMERNSNRRAAREGPPQPELLLAPPVKKKQKGRGPTGLKGLMIPPPKGIRRVLS